MLHKPLNKQQKDLISFYSYITASKSGLSENELEDILCLDEEVLQDVFRFQIPQGNSGKRPFRFNFVEFYYCEFERVVVEGH